MPGGARGNPGALLMTPTLVYRSPGPHFGPGSSTYDFKPARDDAELESLLADGWHGSLEEGLAAVASAENPEPEAPKARRSRKAAGETAGNDPAAGSGTGE